MRLHRKTYCRSDILYKDSGSIVKIPNKRLRQNATVRLSLSNKNKFTFAKIRIRFHWEKVNTFGSA